MNLIDILKRSDDYREERTSSSSHIILQGKLPVMISAPHAVTQLRHGREKQSESLTGVLAELLQKQGIHAIIKTRNLNDDANYDSVSSYRSDLAEYIKNKGIICLIDLHIMSDTRENLVETATNEGRNIQLNWWMIELLKNTAANEGILDFANDLNFNADNPNCVAATISQECGIPAIQMEINWRHMNAEENEEGFKSIYFFLLRAFQIIATQKNNRVSTVGVSERCFKQSKK